MGHWIVVAYHQVLYALLASGGHRRGSDRGHSHGSGHENVNVNLMPMLEELANSFFQRSMRSSDFYHKSKDE